MKKRQAQSIHGSLNLNTKPNCSFTYWNSCCMGGENKAYRVFIYNVSAQLTSCLRDLARYFKTELTKTVAFCFGIPENTVSSRAI
jgi:hypothetical protein